MVIYTCSFQCLFLLNWLERDQERNHLRFLLLWRSTVCIHNSHYESFQTCRKAQRIINICDLSRVGQMLTFAVFALEFHLFKKVDTHLKPTLLPSLIPFFISIQINHSTEAKMSFHIHIFKYMYYILYWQLYITQIILYLVYGQNLHKCVTGCSAH